MALPTPQDCRDELEGYSITPQILSDAWIQKKIDTRVIPFIEAKIDSPITTSTKEVVQLYSGNGESTLILDNKLAYNIKEIKIIGLDQIYGAIPVNNVSIVAGTGILKITSNISEGYGYAYFPSGNKNIQITYDSGFESDIPDDLNECIIYLTCVEMLKQIAGRTGGGNLSVQGFSRQYGAGGKYSDPRKEYKSDGYEIIRKYASSGVVGN